MKILVTGGAGFIGSHIVDLLVESDFEVVVVDNLSSGKTQNVNSHAKFYLVDIRSRELGDIFRIENPTHVIHQAAQVNVRRSFQDPFFDVKSNVLGTMNVLQNSIQFGVQKLVYASSAAVYGEPEYLGIDEEHKISPISPYGISKYSAELYMKVNSSQLGWTILRYANVYGCRQDADNEGGVVSIFASRLLRSESPFIYGNGTQTRDFVHVKDVAAANIQALTRGKNETINIGTSVPTSINQLLDTMEAIFGFEGERVYEFARKGDIHHSYLSNQKAKGILDWEPKYNLASGLQDLFDETNRHIT